MKKIIGVILFISILVGFSFYAYKNFLPKITPPSKDVKQYLPANTGSASPIKVPQGLKIDVFADLGSEMPRVLAFDENGALFVTATFAGKIYAFKDENRDLKPDQKLEIVNGLNKPHGIVFDGDFVYVAETDKVSRFSYDPDAFSFSNKQILFDLPSGGRHFTRTIKIYNNRLYTSVGSSCDVCRESNPYRAAILSSNLDGSDLKVFASGLRNTVFFDFDKNGNIWGMDMGRDNLGDNLPPEELNIIEENKNYGWPYCYGQKIKDTKFNSDQSITCENTTPPVFELPAHSAPLGIVFDSAGNLLVALHGSWNSTVPVGYKIVKLNVFGGGVNNSEDYIYGFLQSGGDILGRPVDLKFDSFNNLFITDDKAGLIYVVSKDN